MAGRPHVLIAESRYYKDISDELRDGAVGALEDAGATHEVVWVPGCFELPAAISMASGVVGGVESARFGGYLALGCVIRGETSHYDHVCTETARGLQALALEKGLAIGFGVLTCENRDQAWARASVEQLNKGAEAADACLRMIALKKQFGVGW